MIDLQPFCDIEGARYAIDKPFVKDGVRYATDGRIAIAVKAEGEPDTPPQPQPFPKVWGVFVRPDDPHSLSAWPTEPKFYEGGRDCPKCEGCGSVDNPKAKKGYSACHDCDGTGSITDPRRWAEISPTCDVDGRYWQLVASLPNVAYYQPKPLKAIYFRFTGGEGALMPVSGVPNEAKP